jgi:hypothetical protein
VEGIMAYSRNEGIVQSGGTINAGNLAIGRNAVANQTHNADSGALEEVRNQLASLMDALQKHAQEIPNSAEVMQSAHTAQEELSKDKPSRLTLRSLLSGIAESVKSVTTVAAAVEALKVAVTALFG